MAISEDLKKVFLPPQPPGARLAPAKTHSPPAVVRANPRDRALGD
jgi:hypothetical protein